MKIAVTKEQARKFLLKKQLLFPPQSLHGGQAVEEVFNSLRLIQYDPLNPCGRNTDLVLQARISDYHPDNYQHWLYEQKKGIECYDKELCILPIEDFSLSQLRRGKAQNAVTTQQFLKKYQHKIEALLQQIEKDGPVSSADIIDKAKVMSGWGTEATFGRIALETLWEMGRLVVVKREQMKKYYDLPHRVHKSLIEDAKDHALTKEHVLRRMRSVGLLPKSGSRGGWQGLGRVKDIAVIIDELLTDKMLVEISIADCARRYVILAQDESLFVTEQQENNKRVVFIAPLDNLMWDRGMIEELFNFSYRWEVYTPISKRKYGYYVLPILYGDTFIGRIEPMLRKDKTLEIKGFWQEDKLLWDKAVWNDFAEALETFKHYLNTTTVVNTPHFF